MKAIITFTAVVFVSALNTFCQSASAGQHIWPLARVNLRVIDETGTPIPDVRTEIAFCSATNHSEGVPVTGLTATNGVFVAQGHSYGTLGSRLKKDGYYLGWGNVPDFKIPKDGRWQPWDATYTTVLRKIENPVPVYAEWGARISVPEVGKPCGYDLMEGDWVSPWGKGKVPDFVFTMHNTYSNYLNYEVTMELGFSNPLDGIQKTELPKEYGQSEFQWPRLAPETGYQPSWRQEFGIPHKQYRVQDIEKQKFFFRVRTVERDGKIVSALYGKLWEGFHIGATSPQQCIVRISYYLNPAPLDRNMEFDLQRNLLKKIGQFEEPRRP
jgi:hypothetical protein